MVRINGSMSFCPNHLLTQRNPEEPRRTQFSIHQVGRQLYVIDTQDCCEITAETRICFQQKKNPACNEDCAAQAHAQGQLLGRLKLSYNIIQNIRHRDEISFQPWRSKIFSLADRRALDPPAFATISLLSGYRAKMASNFLR